MNGRNKCVNWLDATKSNRVHIVHYEALVDATTGIDETIEFLSYVESSTGFINWNVPKRQIPCLWSRVISFDLYGENAIGKQQDYGQSYEITSRRHLRVILPSKRASLHVHSS